MPFQNAYVTFLQVFDAANKLAINIASGASQFGFGSAKIQLFTNSNWEKVPAEIYAFGSNNSTISIQSGATNAPGNGRASISLKSSSAAATVPVVVPTMDLIADVFNLMKAGGYPNVFMNNGTLEMDVNGILNTGTVNVAGSVVNSTNPNWIAPALGNSWVNYGLAGYDVAGYCQHADGTVELKGLIKNGVVGSGTPVFTLPVGMRPLTGHRLFAQNAAGGVADVRVFTTGNVNVYALYTGATNASVSLDGIRFRP